MRLTPKAFSRRTVRSLMPLEKTPGLISMLAGKPNSSTFPFTSIQLTARSPTDLMKEETLTIGPKQLETALQYGPTAGIPSLLDWIWGLQEFAHGRKRNEGWRSSVGAGSQDVIYKVPDDVGCRVTQLNASAGCQLDLESWGLDPGGVASIRVRTALISPKKNPAEAYYSGVIPMFKAHGCTLVGASSTFYCLHSV